MKGVKLFIAFFIFFGFVININATSDLEIFNKKSLNENNTNFKLESNLQNNKEIDESVLNPIYKDYLNLNDKEKNNLNYVPYKYKNNNIKKNSLLISNSINLLDNDNNLIGLSYPSTYDLRDVGTEHIDYSPTMRDQSSFGLCWAFSFNSMLESYLLRKGFDNARTYNFSEIAADLQQKKLFDYDIVEGNYNDGHEYRYTIGLSSLSDALLNWTYFNPIIEGTLGNSLSESELNGKSYTYENIVNAYNIERRKNGSESAYYVVESIMDDIDRENIIYNDKFEFNVNAKLLNSYYNSLLLTETPNLTSSLINEVEQNISVIKEYIMSSGAVATVTLVPTNFGSTSNNFIHNNFSLSNSSKYYSDKSGHAITIIGWDDNYGDIDGDGNGDGSWIVQNSWGNDSNVNYFYLSYYDVFSLLETYGINSVEKNNSDNLYRNVDINVKFDENEKGIHEYNYYIGESDQKIDYLKINLSSSEKKYVSAIITDGINSCTSNSVLMNNEIVSLSFTDCILKGDVSVNIITKNTSNKNIYDDNDRIDAVLYSTNSIEPLENDILLDKENSDYLLNDEYILNMNYVTIAYKTTTDYFKNDYYNYNIDIIDKNNNALDYDLSMMNGIIYIDLYELNKYRLDDEITMEINYKGNIILSKTFKVREVNTKSFNNNEYILINNIDDLLLLSGYYYLGYFFLNNDIDLSSISDEDNFKITSNNIYFEGYGHTLKNYTSENGALFKSINNSEIYNVKIENFNITSDSIAGILTDKSISSSYDGIKIYKSNVSSKVSGGVIGEIDDSTIIYSSKLEDLTVNAEDIGGGIVGKVNCNNYFYYYNVVGFIDGFIKDITVNAPKKGYIFGEGDILIDVERDDYSLGLEYYKLLVEDEDSFFGQIKIKKYDGLNTYEIDNNSANIIEIDNQFIFESNINNVSSLFSDFYYPEKWFIKNGSWPEIIYFVDGITFDIDTIVSNLNLIDDYYLVLEPCKNVDEYLNKLDIDINTYFLEKNEYGSYDNLLTGSDLVKTGNKMKLNNGIEQKYLSIVIKGDINSDGAVDILDFKKVSNYLISQNPDSVISDYENKMAADIDGNNQIDILDFKRISNYLLSEGF
ncbi:MAG: dockerin type I domain-containing protein [Bacilli bacterium]